MKRTLVHATSIDLFDPRATKRGKARVLSALPPPAPTQSPPTAAPTDPKKALAAVLAALNLPPDAPLETVQAAVASLFGAAPDQKAAEAAARKQLSAKEIALCARKKISPVAYLATRRAIKSRSNGALR